MEELSSGRCMTAGYKDNYCSKQFSYFSSGDCDKYIMVSENDYIGAKAMDFSEANEIEVCTKSDNGPNYIEISIGSSKEALFGNLTFLNSNSIWINTKVNIKKISGKNDIYLIFKGSKKGTSNCLFYFLGWTFVTVNNQKMITSSSYSSSSSAYTIEFCIGGNKIIVSKEGYIVINNVTFTFANAIEARIGAKNNDITLNSYIEFYANSIESEPIGILNISSSTQTNYYDVYEIQGTGIKPIFDKKIFIWYLNA